TRKIEGELHQIEDVKFFTSNVGKGNPTIYYNMSQASENVGYADIFVQLHDDVKAKKKELLIEELRQKWTNYLGANIEVKNFEQGVPVLSPVEVRLFGDDLDTLQRLAADVEELLKNIPGNVYINNPLKNKKTDLRVLVNREKALALGVPTVRIDQTVRIALAGYEVGIFTDPKVDNNEYSILATVSRPNMPDMTVFDGIFVNNVEGTAIPLAQLATLAFESSPPNIYRQDKNRMVSVNASVAKGFTNDAVIQEVIKKMDAFSFPTGYSYEMGGEVESRETAFGGFGTIIMVTVFLFIAVLILEFKTFKSTLIVLSVIPLGIVGAVLALLVTGNTLSFV